MARIAGVDIPREKRLEISLTYIFGIGRTTSQTVCDQVGISREREVARVGPLEVTTTERETFTVPTVLSGVAIAAGLALIIAVRRAK